MTYSSFRSIFEKLREGIIVRETGELVTIHGIRHTFASERVGLVDSVELMGLMGQKSFQTTLGYITTSKQKMLKTYDKTKHLSLV